MCCCSFYRNLLLSWTHFTLIHFVEHIAVVEPVCALSSVNAANIYDSHYVTLSFPSQMHKRLKQNLEKLGMCSCSQCILWIRGRLYIRVHFVQCSRCQNQIWEIFHFHQIWFGENSSLNDESWLQIDHIRCYVPSISIYVGRMDLCLCVVGCMHNQEEIIYAYVVSVNVMYTSLPKL